VTIPVSLELDLFQETEQRSMQAADDRHQATGLYEVELERASGTACVPPSVAGQTH